MKDHESEMKKAIFFVAGIFILLGASFLLGFIIGYIC